MRGLTFLNLLLILVDHIVTHLVSGDNRRHDRLIQEIRKTLTLGRITHDVDAVVKAAHQFGLVIEVIPAAGCQGTIKRTTDIKTSRIGCHRQLIEQFFERREIIYHPSQTLTEAMHGFLDSHLRRRACSHGNLLLLLFANGIDGCLHFLGHIGGIFVGHGIVDGLVDGVALFLQVMHPGHTPKEVLHTSGVLLTDVAQFRGKGQQRIVASARGRRVTTQPGIHKIPHAQTVIRVCLHLGNVIPRKILYITFGPIIGISRRGFLTIILTLFLKEIGLGHTLEIFRGILFRIFLVEIILNLRVKIIDIVHHGEERQPGTVLAFRIAFQTALRTELVLIAGQIAILQFCCQHGLAAVTGCSLEGEKQAPVVKFAIPKNGLVGLVWIFNAIIVNHEQAIQNAPFLMAPCTHTMISFFRVNPFMLLKLLDLEDGGRQIQLGLRNFLFKGLCMFRLLIFDLEVFIAQSMDPLDSRDLLLAAHDGLQVFQRLRVGLSVSFVLYYNHTFLIDS